MNETNEAQAMQEDVSQKKVYVELYEIEVVRDGVVVDSFTQETILNGGGVA